MAAVKCCVMLLTKEESRNVANLGYAYAYKNKDRWIEVGFDDVHSLFPVGYDSSRSYIVNENTAYTMYKDYLIIDENIHLFLGQNRDLDTDRVETTTSSTESETTDSGSTSMEADTTVTT